MLLYSDQKNSGLRVTACSREATRLQVRIGMPLAEARAICQGGSFRRTTAEPVWACSDHDADRQALQQLARDCQRYAPLVGLEEADWPESLWLDIAGCEHLHGGERGLLRAVFKDFRMRGYDVQLALAETLGAAWALAHYGSGMPCVAGDRQRIALQRLPVAALRLSAPIQQTLYELDIRTIQDLQCLPRTSLPARFGAIILRRLDQAFDECPESFTPEKSIDPITEVWTTEEPLTDQKDLTEIFYQLLDRLLLRLSVRRAGILELECSFQTEQSRSRISAITLQLSQPTLDAAHLRQLFELRCGQQEWQTGILGMQAEIVRAGWLREIPRSLFDDDPQNDPRAIEALMERLTSRLGESAVTQPLRVADPLPERSYQLVSWFEKEQASVPSLQQTLLLEMRQRPWQLLATPQRLEVIALYPEGPPQRIEKNGQWQRIIRSWGPERIESGWWRERDIRRDYYRIETEQAGHWWIFRERESGHWFLHGWF